MSAEVVTNAAEVAAGLIATAVQVDEVMSTVVLTQGAVLMANIKRNASKPRGGPPGPRLITGNYVRSINMQPVTVPGAVGVSIGTNAPQALRLEYGFTGTDSLGRNYNQPPYPHFGPALDAAGPALLEAINVALGAVAAT